MSSVEPDVTTRGWSERADRATERGISVEEPVEASGGVPGRTAVANFGWVRSDGHFERQLARLTWSRFTH